MNCKTCLSEMPELILDQSLGHSIDQNHAAGQATLSNLADARAHLDACPACQKEFADFQSTFALLDAWQAPEPSPYFDQKFAVRLREEQAAPPASWFERLQDRLLFNTGRQFRPALAGALALALVLGGGTFAGISSLPAHHDPAQVSAAVDDLQILDKNDQALQQMDQLLQDNQPADDTSAVPPRS